MRSDKFWSMITRSGLLVYLSESRQTLKILNLHKCGPVGQNIIQRCESTGLTDATDPWPRSGCSTIICSHAARLYDPCSIRHNTRLCRHVDPVEHTKIHLSIRVVL